MENFEKAGLLKDHCYIIKCLPLEDLMARPEKFRFFLRDKSFGLTINPYEIDTVCGINVKEYVRYTETPVKARYIGHGDFEVIDGPVNFTIPARFVKLKALLCESESI